MNRTIGIAVRLIGLVLAALMLTGCVGAGAVDSSPSTSTCAAAPDLSRKPPTVAILRQDGQGADKYAVDLTKVITGAESIKGRVIVNGVGSNDNAPSMLANVVLVPEGENDTVRQENIDCKEKLIRDAFTGTLAKQPDPKPVDVFSAIYTLSGNLQGRPAGSTTDVVLLTSLLNSSSIADLTNASTLQDPTGVLNTLAAARLKPDCSGWRVSAIGASTESAAQDAQLRELWRRYFEWCGGALVAWSSHVVTFPVSGPAIAAADTTQIPIFHNGSTIVATLSGDVTFEDGKAELRPAAADELDQVLPLTVEGKGPISIDGYADVDSGEDPHWLDDLSSRRSEAVKAWLVTHGVAAERISAHGHGSSSPVFPHPRTPEEHQANRRVVVTIYKT